MILLQLSSAQCRSRHGHLFSLKTVVSGTHDLAIGSRNGFLVGIQKAGFGLDVIRMHCLRIPTCCEFRIAMNAAIWHHPLPFNETPTVLMPLEGVARRLDQRVRLRLRLQWVDGRRVDAFVADLLHSRVQRGAAPTVSNVSA